MRTGGLLGTALAIFAFVGAATAFERLELGSPAEVDRSGKRLKGVDLTRICRLSPECSRGALQPLDTVARPAFFESCRARDSYCGAPGGFLDWVRVSGDAPSRALPHPGAAATGTARDVLYRNGTWETPWAELRHLADPPTCLAAVGSSTATAATAAAATGGINVGTTRASRRGRKHGLLASNDGSSDSRGQAWSTHGTGGAGSSSSSGKSGSQNRGAGDGGSQPCSLSLAVPLVELRDVFLGGQFVPFTADGGAFVPLATAHEWGGLAPSSSSSSTKAPPHALRGPAGIAAALASASAPPAAAGEAEQPSVPGELLLVPTTTNSSAEAGCCFATSAWATDERGALGREREALLWAQPQHLAKAPVSRCSLLYRVTSPDGHLRLHAHRQTS
jgi:hypothetical protein